MGLPNAIGDFSELFNKMEEDIKSGFIRRGNIKDALKLKPYEKQISFLNKYFVFKKVRDVNAKDVATAIIGSIAEDEEPDIPEIAQAEKALEKINRPKAKKIRKKMKLFTD